MLYNENVIRSDWVKIVNESNILLKSSLTHKNDNIQIKKIY